VRSELSNADRLSVRLSTRYVNHGAKGSGYYELSLVCDIDNHVTTHFGGRGVLSLATHWDNALMWSHYADEHRGICIEFNTRDHRCDRLEPVTYSSTRYLLVSDLLAWQVGKSLDAERKIDKQFLRKIAAMEVPEGMACDCTQTWGRRRPFPHCDSSVQRAVVRMLADEREAIQFYGVWSKDDGFRLGRYPIDVD